MGPWHVPWYLPTLLASGHAGLQGGLARELIVTTRQVLPLPLSEQRQPTIQFRPLIMIATRSSVLMCCMVLQSYNTIQRNAT